MLSLFSKIKQWILKHLFTVITVSVTLLIGVGTLLLGGALAGWDIAGALTSSTAILIYIIIGTAVVCIVCKALLDKFNM